MRCLPFLRRALERLSAMVHSILLKEPHWRSRECDRRRSAGPVSDRPIVAGTSRRAKASRMRDGQRDRIDLVGEV